jgi:hypothetical protein
VGGALKSGKSSGPAAGAAGGIGGAIGTRVAPRGIITVASLSSNGSGSAAGGGVGEDNAGPGAAPRIRPSPPWGKAKGVPQSLHTWAASVLSVSQREQIFVMSNSSCLVQ